MQCENDFDKNIGIVGTPPPLPTPLSKGGRGGDLPKTKSLGEGGGLEIFC